MMKKILIILFAVMLSFAGYFVTGCAKLKDAGPGDSDSMPQRSKQFTELLKNSNFQVEDTQGNEISSNKIVVQRQWEGNICRSILKNISDTVLYPKDVIIFDIPNHGLNPNSPVYGEGFQMLHQNGGTLGNRQNIGNHPDNKHYKIPDLNGLPTAYGVLNIDLKEDEKMLLGFTSCSRFIGRISYDHRRLLVSLDIEGLMLRPGQSWPLEDFMLIAGESKGKLFDEFSKEINNNHPPRRTSSIPTGWCSWYCYRMDITDEIMKDNLDSLANKLPELRYIQLDDGYQPFQGDWLDSKPGYGDVRKTIDAIREKGFEPAIWVAPFVAQKESRVFREHPDWFIKNKDGLPLNSATIGFGGWRYAPWYVLDGTNPEVGAHLQGIFRTMRQEWGVNYFKLDANYWGAIHGGDHYDKDATRIQAYRRGMEAILKGCDNNTVILGCNAPIWPSLGLVTAMRTSGDIRRSWKSFRNLAVENFSRCWQNGRLWDLDPDCIVLARNGIFGVNEDVSENEWMFHATSIHAVGGMTLSGDKAEDLNDRELQILKKLLKPTGKGAVFADTKMQVGVTDLGSKQFYYFFNWGDTDHIELTVRLKSKSRLTDFWTDEDLGIHNVTYTVTNLAPRSAKLIMATPK